VCGDKSRAAGIEVWNVWSGKRPKSSVALPNAATLTELSAWGRPPTDGFAWCSSTATGWPFPCFVKHYEVTELRPDRLGALTARDRALTVMAISQLRRWTGALVWNPGSYSETAFPVVPLWGPLLADWGIFTAALLLPVLAVRFVVVLRRKPWRCPSCGYDRRGLAAAVKCPECGTPTSPAP
jgi:hypothetical protein